MDVVPEMEKEGAGGLGAANLINCLYNMENVYLPIKKGGGGVCPHLPPLLGFGGLS